MSASADNLVNALENRRELNVGAGVLAGIKRILRRKDRREGVAEVRVEAYCVHIEPLELEELEYPLYSPRHWCWDLGCHLKEWRPYEDYEI